MNPIVKFIEYLKNALNNQSKKQVVENSIIVIIIGIIIIIAGSSLFGTSKEKTGSTPEKESDTNAMSKTYMSNEKAEIEQEIETILSQIDGAGRVSVMVTYLSGKEIIPAYDSKKSENDTREKDAGGGTRNINQNDYENKIVYEESQGGTRKPVIIKEIHPEVKGVVVVADGAYDARVKENLSRAVQALLGVPPHKIQIFARRK